MANDSGSWLGSRLGAMAKLRPPTNRSPQEEEGPRGMVLTLCVLASTLLWFSFSMRETRQRMLEIPLQVVNLGDGEALTSNPPESARVQIEGEGIQLLRLYYNPPSIPVDASEANFDLITAAQEVISGVRIETIIPRTVALRKDLRISKRVPVRPRVSVVTNPGHHVVGTPAVQPDSVEITGAQGILSSIEAWPTRNLQVQPNGDTLAVVVALSDSLADLVELNASSVTYSASVREFTEGVREVEVTVVGAPPQVDVTFEPAVVQVIYQVALDQFDQAMQAPDFYARVDFEPMERDTTGTVTPVVFYPDGIRFREYRLVPPTVGYFFEVID